ncbi:hypothetical protein AZJ20_09035 [Streptococcus pneumoniae]|nr:hypothetical protein AZJ20_09035 [Streptococcus pneumoniae]VMV70294.1 zinc metalloprotease ZmpD [Streptococcus pneumoniae]
MGSLLFAPSVVGASPYHYLDYSNLTQNERAQLKSGRPDKSKESYALVYEKDALPNTGSSQSIMTALGLLAIGSLIVIITKDKKRKKIATFLIVGATGLVTLSTASALNLNANIHESGRDGVLQISSYRYVGYLELDDRTVSSVSPASTVSPVEQPKVVTEKGEPEIHEKPDYTQPIGANLVEPEVHEKLAYTEPVGTTEVDENGNLIEPPVSEKPEYTQPVGMVPDEAPKTEKPEYTEPVGTAGVDENGNLIEPPVSNIPEYTEPISTVSEVASEREESPSLHTDIRTETIPKTTIEESDPTKFIGDNSVKQIGEDGERQIVTSYEELHGKKISEPVETVTILKEMKPEILVSGVESDSNHLTSLPSDVTNYYLKVTSRENKVTRLAIDKIEEVIEEGKQLYKVTAKAPDLVQRDKDGKLRDTYTYYFEKPRATEDKVYYNFHDLAKDMQANPTGEFKLGADLNAVNVKPAGKAYVMVKFRGILSSVENHQYTIHNLERPLFNEAEGATLKNFNLGNVNINMPWADKVAPIGNMFKNSTLENIKVVGSVTGNNDVTGAVNKLDEANMRNVAFIGKINSLGDKGWWSGGLVSESWRSNVDSSYIDADIKANNSKVGGLIAKIDHGVNPMDVKQRGRLTKSVVKGTMTLKNHGQSGGVIHDNYNWGWVENNVSMMKVNNGEIMYGSGSVDSGDPDFGFHYFKNNVYVRDVASGNVSYKRSKQIQGVDQAEADKRIATFNITADKYEITDPLVNTLNNLTTRDNEYKTTQDYKAEREQAYRNIEKLQPFYNKEWIVNQGNKLTDESNLVKKTVLSVTGMKAGQFVTDLSDIDKIMVHYADGTKEELTVTAKTDSKVAQVKEYDVAGQNIVYTPNMVMKNRNQLASGIKEKLASVTLLSDEVRALMDKREKPLIYS